MLDVVALGELLIDFSCRETDADGYPIMEGHPGGAPANFLAALTVRGMKTALLGKVGDDEFGRLLIGTLNKAGICTDGLVLDRRFFTTLSFVTFDEHGDRSFSFARKPGADTQIAFDELRLDLIDEARVFHFGTLSLTDEPAKSATYRAIDYAKERGKLITYDPNLRELLWDDLEEAKRQILYGLTKADVVKIGDTETEFIFGEGISEEDAAKRILDMGAKLVFVTLGKRGAYYMNKNARGTVPTIQGIKTIDTTGAGDIFGGCAVAGILKSGKAPDALNDDELREIVTYACTAASLSTAKAGAISSIPAPEEVFAAMGK